MDYNFVII